MRKSKFYYTIAFALLGACREPGGAEKAGQRVDEIVDNVKEGENPLKKKGPAEKLGENIDESISDSEDSKKSDKQ